MTKIDKTISSKDLKEPFGQPVDITIRSLNWKQPFGQAMLVGKIETRTWHTNYRGWVLMCASQAPYTFKQLEAISGRKLLHKLLNDTSCLDQLNMKYRKDLPHGSAFAIGYLSDCYRMTKSDEEATYVKYQPGLYCHVYKSVFTIKEFDRKGFQKWGTVNQDELRQIRIVTYHENEQRIYSNPFSLSIIKNNQKIQ